MEGVNILLVIAPFGMVDVVHGTEGHGVGAGSISNITRSRPALVDPPTP